MPRSEAVLRIRGKAGETVRLGLQRAGEQSRTEAVLTREPLVSHSLIGATRRPDGIWDFHLPQHPRIAYVRLVKFGKHTAEELQTALAEVGEPSELAGVILDLRDNGGGYLRAAIAVCDLFLDEGVIVTFRDRTGVVLEQHQASPALAVAQRVPLAILANKYSASSSEVVAACLQDHQRAVVIGERTWGKGSVQKLFDLKSGGALKLTVATYWRPSGVNIHRGNKDGEGQTWGVLPNQGYEVSVSDEEHRRVFQEQRWRSVPAVDTRDATEEPQSDPAPPPVDRVRQRAVEYLQSVSNL
jgi:carboxyl-terminal processing protease